MKESTSECYEKCYQVRVKELINYGLAYNELNDFENYKDILSENEFHLIMNEKQNRKNKRHRVKEKFKELYKLESILPNAKVVFITIDPNDETLSKKENTYIRLIHKWLKQHFLYSILNKDYGDKSGREHYHALAITTEEIEQLFHENGKPKLSKKGYEMFELVDKDFQKTIKSKTLQFEPTLNLINLNKNDMDKTTNYLLKLNNHSNKKTAARSRVRIIKSPLMKTCFELRKER